MADKSWSSRLVEWMRGRNGSDELGTAVVAVSFVLLLINLFTGARWVSVLALAAALYACWRISSTNVAARRAENQRFLSLLEPVLKRAPRTHGSASQAQDYLHLSCPECGQRVRVPRGKGNIRITCPTCQNKFDAHS